MQNYDLARFVTAQNGFFGYDRALAEIRAGRKQSHWMWYIFPQLTGLGRSETARFYGIRDLGEAVAYLAHPVLGPRLREISAALLELESCDALAVMGSPDHFKLRSCMTLFLAADPTAEVFQHVLDKFYQGRPDGRTLGLLQKQR